MHAQSHDWKAGISLTEMKHVHGWMVPVTSKTCPPQTSERGHPISGVRPRLRGSQPVDSAAQVSSSRGPCPRGHPCWGHPQMFLPTPEPQRARGHTVWAGDGGLIRVRRWGVYGFMGSLFIGEFNAQAWEGGGEKGGSRLIQLSGSPRAFPKGTFPGRGHRSSRSVVLLEAGRTVGAVSVGDGVSETDVIATLVAAAAISTHCDQAACLH